MRSKQGEAPQASPAPTEHAVRGPQRDKALHRGHGKGPRGSEARADYRATTPDERACATTGTACRPPEAAAAGDEALAGATEKAAARRPATQQTSRKKKTEQAGRTQTSPADEGGRAARVTGRGNHADGVGRRQLAEPERPGGARPKEDRQHKRTTCGAGFAGPKQEGWVPFQCEAQTASVHNNTVPCRALSGGRKTEQDARTPNSKMLDAFLLLMLYSKQQMTTTYKGENDHERESPSLP